MTNHCFYFVEILHLNVLLLRLAPTKKTVYGYEYKYKLEEMMCHRFVISLREKPICLIRPIMTVIIANSLIIIFCFLIT